MGLSLLPKEYFSWLPGMQMYHLCQQGKLFMNMGISHGLEGLSENCIESIHLTETEFVS
jgi:hypothetical protein